MKGHSLPITMLLHSIVTTLSLAAAAAAGTIPQDHGNAARNAIGACGEPTVRKEWRELTNDEKAEYIRAAKCIRELPQKKYPGIENIKSRMDDLTYTHLILNDIIHFVANFLPWHRWFVQHHEDILRNECGYTGAQPYWDWSIEGDAGNFPNSPMFDPVTGFGGNGQETHTNITGFRHCLLDGPFANTTYTLGEGWPVVNNEGHELHCLTRDFEVYNQGDEDGNEIPGTGNYQSSAYDSSQLARIYATEQFSDFASLLEGVPHAQIHQVILGDMGPSTSPNEPLFMLHHANVDRVWAKWQGRNATRLADYAGFNDANGTIPASINDVMPVMELGDNVIIKNYMDIQAAGLCYSYST
ncbi:Tyrosinase ustQ [Paramyrothecium foliicola]|nr:Tyrosinase ustQ [Paramyrothecium foliicola]